MVVLRGAIGASFLVFEIRGKGGGSTSNVATTLSYSMLTTAIRH